MALEAERTIINVNGVSVPGVNRDGVFIGEQPINTFLLFRANAFVANTSRTFLIDFPVTPKTAIISDTTNNNTYIFTILTAEGITWTITVAASQVTAYGNTKVFNFPPIVMDKASKATVAVTNAIQAMCIFANFAYNIEVRDF